MSPFLEGFSLKAKLWCELMAEGPPVEGLNADETFSELLRGRYQSSQLE
jgi:hypothetical protein